MTADRVVLSEPVQVQPQNVFLSVTDCRGVLIRVHHGSDCVPLSLHSVHGIQLRGEKLFVYMIWSPLVGEAHQREAPLTYCVTTVVTEACGIRSSYSHTALQTTLGNLALLPSLSELENGLGRAQWPTEPRSVLHSDYGRGGGQGDARGGHQGCCHEFVHGDGQESRRDG